MKHGGLHQVDRTALEVQRHHRVVAVENFCALIKEDAIRQAGRATGVHQHRGIGLFALVGNQRVGRRKEILVRDIVGYVAGSDQHDLFQSGLVADRVDQSCEEAIDETDFRLRIAKHIGKFFGCEPKVQRVDDTAAEECGVVHLEVGRGIERHDRESITASHAHAA